MDLSQDLNRSVGAEVHGVPDGTRCANCGTTRTPLWRRAPDSSTICNACGLYQKARNTARSTPALSTQTPTSLAASPDPQPQPQQPQQQPATPEVNMDTSTVVSCANCTTTTTPLWRRDESGNTICNACGLYHKLHGVHRPGHMKKNVIKRRKR
ncbi:hypothetical protein BCR37DRAFT_348336, partial [Protomyces lactucae-debilis]